MLNCKRELRLQSQRKEIGRRDLKVDVQAVQCLCMLQNPAQATHMSGCYIDGCLFELKCKTILLSVTLSAHAFNICLVYLKLCWFMFLLVCLYM